MPRNTTAGSVSQEAAQEVKSASDDGLNAKGLQSWDPTNWVEPSKANKTSYRILAIAAVVGLGASTSGVVSPKWSTFAHLLAFSAWFGSTFWTTFIAGITMYKNLPRQTFGSLQSKLFPKYFQLAAVCNVVLLACRVRGWTVNQDVCLALALVSTLLNLLWLEPSATACMFKRYRMEKEESQDRDAIAGLRKEFGKWHGMSSMANLVGLLASVYHGFWLAMRMA